jgi:hypothetical protein
MKKNTIRTFPGGANRNPDDDKHDYEGFLSPIVIHRYGEYMHKHRELSNGELRDSDNWQHGITLESYIESLYRHLVDLHLEHRGYESREGIEDALCGIIFNTMGYLHVVLKNKGYLKKITKK